MVSLTHPPSPTDLSRSEPGLGYDFALLGLRAHEARVGRIRQAAEATADRIRAADLDRSEEASMLGAVALATYRLLDPRRRRRTAHRIRLCVLEEEDLQRAESARRPLLPAATDAGSSPTTSQCS
ncbi:MAG: hypothetical protein D6753_09040 [Planctomycetota bacterium]|nr:MAG: hypothetical protein D6753_09040 [Planctomycetota bacterium]